MHVAIFTQFRITNYSIYYLIGLDGLFTLMTTAEGGSETLICRKRLLNASLLVYQSGAGFSFAQIIEIVRSLL